MASQRIRSQSVAVRGRLAQACVGGSGDPLVLVHGGWGGAALHWASVWDELTERHRVIAPELPGIGLTDWPALTSVGDYASWLDALLEALDVKHAWCIGNSFGASVVSELATEHPERCRGVVLVNGFPLPKSPAVLRWLGERRFGHALMCWLEKRIAYSPKALERGFSDPNRVPAELRRLVGVASPPQVEAFASILVQGGSTRARPNSPLLLWGEDDHLPGTSAPAGRKLRAEWPGAELRFVAHAGHMPQLENPVAFLEALYAFLDAHAGEHAATAGANA